MFNLLRYFSLTSAAAMIVATTVIVIVFHDHETNDYVEHAQIANSRLATVFSTVFLKEFSKRCPVPTGQGTGVTALAVA